MRRPALLAFLLAFPLYLAVADGEFLGFGIDDAHYLLQARRFAAGDSGRVTMHFPVLYPALLAPAVRAVPDVPRGILLYQAIAAASAALAVALAYRLFTERLGWTRGPAVVLSTLVALCPPWLRLAAEVMSDLPFAAASIAFLSLYLRLRDAPASRPGSRLGLALLGVVAIGLRVIGVALLLAVLADLALRAIGRRRARREDLVLAGLLLGAAGLWIGLVDRTVPYQFAYKVYPGWEKTAHGWEESRPLGTAIAERFGRALPRRIAVDVVDTCIPILETRFVHGLEEGRPGGIAVGALRAILVLVLAIGFFERLLGPGRVLALHALVVMLVLAWQIFPIGRFLVPLVPFLYDFLFLGARRLARLARTGPTGTAAALASIALLALAGSAIKDARAIAGVLRHGHAAGPEVAAERRAVLASLAEVAKVADPGDRVAMHWPWPHLGLVYHPGSFESVWVRRPAEALDLEYVFLYPYDSSASLEANLATHLAGNPGDPAVADLAARARLVHASPGGRYRLYRLALRIETAGRSERSSPQRVGRRAPMYPTEVQEVARTIEVSSPAFAEGNRIPTRYTGEGRDVSPPLEWRMLPPGTQELAVVCDDPDAPGDEPWVHWVAYKIPVGKERLDEGRIGDALEGINDFGKRGWNGPMPPRGHGVHHYHFKVYALDLQLDVEPGLTKAQLLDAMEGHVLAWGEVIVEYERK